MDFAFNEEQQAIKDLAKQIFKDKCTEEALREVETSGRFVLDAAWDELVKSQLAGIALPESVGGGGMSEFELVIVLTQMGRYVAPVPMLPSIVQSATALAEFGSDEQKQLVRDVLAGDRLLTTGLHEDGSLDIRRVATTATATDGGYTVNGTKTAVAIAEQASHVLINAADDAGDVVFLVVPLDTDGITVNQQRQTNFEPVSQLEFNDVSVSASARLGGADQQASVADFVELRCLLGKAAVQLGLAEQALFFTAEYATTRKQFNKPIGMFQAVSQRAGDAYIDVASIRLMVWKAAFELSQGKDAARAVRVAAYHAAECGHRVVAAAQHIHGGMGFDCDYPLHRYFLTMKALEFQFGGARAQLAALGERIREGGVQ